MNKGMQPRTTIEERLGAYLPKQADCPFIQILMQTCSFHMGAWREPGIGTEVQFYWYIPGSGKHRMARFTLEDCDQSPLAERSQMMEYYISAKFMFLKEVQDFIKGAIS